MTVERGDATGPGAKGAKAHKFLGSLKDALMAASRDDTLNAKEATPVAVVKPAALAAMSAAVAKISADAAEPVTAQVVTELPRASDAARLARTVPAERPAGRVIEADAPPTTRVFRREALPRAARTVLVRGKQTFDHAQFAQDPVVGFLVVVGGPGLGAFRPIYEGNNTIGRTQANRIPFDFGDDSISAEEQAYLRYDSADRSFLFVPNLAKTNVVSVNDKRPAGAVELKAMDVIVLGRTQAAFVPFCGADFDWSEIA